MSGGEPADDPVARPDASNPGTATDDANTILGLPAETVLVLAVVIAAVVTWELLAQVAFDRLEIVFPSLVTIGAALVELITPGEFYYHIWITTQEVAVAFVLAAVIGILGGTIVGSNDFLAKAVEPIIYYFSTIPKIVLYPLFLVALGVGFESKVAMGFFSAIFPITVNTITGTLNVRDDLVKVANVYDASFLEIFRWVYLPSTITHVVNGIRLGVGVAIIGVLLGELAASQAGVGNQVKFFFSNLNTAKMYAALIMVFAVSLAINLLLLRFQSFLAARGYGAGDSDETIGF
jgi:ABC-type nitrate/sulfonate/bicarbonate transport system permease component